MSGGLHSIQGSPDESKGKGSIANGIQITRAKPVKVQFGEDQGARATPKKALATNKLVDILEPATSNYNEARRSIWHAANPQP